MRVGFRQGLVKKGIYPIESKDMSDIELEIPQKPKGSSGIFRWWLRKLWLGWRTTCPRCEQGAMFESFFKIRKRCPTCNVKFQPHAGDELGVIAVGYFATTIPALIGLVLAYAYTDWTSYQLLFFFFFLTTAILIGLYKNMKGLWVGFVFLLTGLKRL